MSHTEDMLKFAKEFFFKAMMHGYAGGITPTEVPGMPWFKEIEYINQESSWRCVDRWCSRPDSERSAGTTTIWYCDYPVWTMSYQGWYSEDVIWLLKKAIKSNYEVGLFRGCRGPKDFRDRGLQYVNSSKGEFKDFRGKEKIIRFDTGEVLGYHEYLGMSLMP